MAKLKPVAEWTITEAEAAIKADLVKDYEVNRRIVEDEDQWQEGKLWPGHRTGDTATDNALIRNIEPQFVADDVISEMIENRSSGLLKQEADVALVPLAEPDEEEGETSEGGEPTAAETREEQELQYLAEIAAWWDRKKFAEKVDQAVGRVSYAKRACIRAMVAEGNLVNGRLPLVGSLAEALDLIEVDVPQSDAATVYTDPKAQRKHGVIVVTEDTNKKAEVWSVDPKTKQTSVRVLTNTTPTTLGPFDLGGRIPVAEVRGKRIITASVRRLQSLLNFITTVTGRTVETAGFRERYLGNVEPPGLWQTFPPSDGPPLEVDEKSAGGPFYKHRVPWVLGAPMNQELVGLKTLDANGKETFASPSVTALDPVDPAFATNAAKAVTGKIYRRGKQGHLALDGTTEASGVAYQQARAQFEADLTALKGPVEGMMRDILEAVLALAALMFSGAKVILTNYRVQVTLHVSAGPVTPDEMRLATELRDKRAISQQTMMARVGVEDPAAELEAIQADPIYQMELWSKRIEVYDKAITAGWSAEVAAHISGMTPEEGLMVESGKVPGQSQPPRLSAA